MGWLDGQVALVTGGGSGIGRAVVARFVEEGARVGVLDRVPDRAAQVRSEFGDAVLALAGDVAQLADRIAVMVAGKLVACGTLEELAAATGVAWDRRVMDAPIERIYRTLVQGRSRLQDAA